MNWELQQHEKLFKATGLKVGDRVVNDLGQEGTLYLSGIGYACVRLGEKYAVIWDKSFVKKEKQ